MIYITWEDDEGELNIVTVDSWEEAQEFCKENNLKTEECCDIMCW